VGGLQFFVARGDGAMQLEPVDRPLDSVALPLGVPAEAPVAPLVALARDDGMDAAAAQGVARRAAAEALVAGGAVRSTRAGKAACWWARTVVPSTKCRLQFNSPAALPSAWSATRTRSRARPAASAGSGSTPSATAHIAPADRAKARRCSTARGWR
jgi:hypothetical protein